jgi:5-oxoprolinase (ATP-hydrolysing) subunit A
VTFTVDLNCDVAEGFGRWRLADDHALIAEITSANVACGFHAGDPSLMREVCEAAVRHGVAVGAQVSYPDLVGFGRRFMDMAPGELADAVVYQIGALDALARTAGTNVAYVKPHGALYHATIDHPEQAGALVEAIRALDSSLCVLGAPGSILLHEAQRAGLHVVPEAFIDRAYQADGRLVPRGVDGAVLTSPADIRQRVIDLMTHQAVRTIDGEWVPVSAPSWCLHSDTPGAPELAALIRRTVLEAGGTLKPFVSL